MAVLQSDTPTRLSRQKPPSFIIQKRCSKLNNARNLGQQTIVRRLLAASWGKGWVARPCVLCKGGHDAVDTMSCYSQRPAPHLRRSTFALYHLLLLPALTFSQHRARPRLLHLYLRLYNFNLWTTKEGMGKLRYMHRNPVRRGLVGSPEQWRCNSYRFYLLDETGTVRVNEGWTKISSRDRATELRSFAAIGARATRPLAKKREGTGQPLCWRCQQDQKPGPPAAARPIAAASQTLAKAPMVR